jgi:CBS domain-containing protein
MEVRMKARDIMTVPVRTVDADLEQVATLMAEGKADPLPVLEGGRLIGIVSHTALIQQLEEAQEPSD